MFTVCQGPGPGPVTTMSIINVSLSPADVIEMSVCHCVSSDTDSHQPLDYGLLVTMHMRFNVKGEGNTSSPHSMMQRM